MSTGKQIVKGALRIRGEDSAIMPADPGFFVEGFEILQSVLGTLEAKGVNIVITVPTNIDDELGEAVDTTLFLKITVAVKMLSIRTPVTPDQWKLASSERITVFDKYLNSGVIPEKLFPSTTPKGEGNHTNPWQSEFYSNPDNVLNNQVGVVNAPVGDC